MSREASSSSSSSSIRFFDLSKSTQVEADENGFRTSESSGHFPPSRAPLNAIPDPSQYPKEARKPGSDFGNRIEGSRAIRSSSGRVEASNSLPPGRGSGSVNCSYGCTRVSGRGKPHPEPSSAQTTPAKSASRASNIGGAGAWTVPRPLQYAGAGEGSCSRVSRGISSAISEPEVHHFELVEDPSFWIDRNVQVLIRIRPLSTLERTLQGCNRCLRQESAQSLAWLGHPETRFTFDNIACETISQEKLFRVAGLPTVDNCMSGYNSCIFAYGQTGSGKTYTMMGDMQYMERKVNDDCGMTPRIFDYLFMRIKAEEEKRRAEKLKFTCKCSFLEIYNEQIMDLLEPSSVNLQLREDLIKGVYVENLTEYSVTSVNDVVKLLSKGAAHRKMAATQMNGESSRSHSVFTCIIESQWENDFRSHFRFGRLNLVDLAGSERQKCSGAEGGRLKEAANINKSLSTLSLVIMSLVDLANGKHRHVPYRDSRLAFLLQDSLGGNSKTTIIANISPSICYADETLSTLKFAQRAKLIQNNAKVNDDASDDVLALQTQIVQLKDQLSFMMKHHNVSSLSNFLQCFEEYRSSIPLEELGNSAEETLADDVGKVVSTWTGGGWIDHQADDAVQKHIKNDQEMHNLLVMQLADTQKELMDARFLIEAMESDHVCLHNELLFLQEENNRYKEIFSNKNLVTNNCWDLSREYLRTKVDKMSEELEQARLLNSQYQEDRAIQLSRQQQVDIVSEQAELETVKTILHLQDEIVALKLEFKENLHCMDEENTRLRKTIVAKEDELRASCIEWERAILELTTFLLNGSISLKEASGQIQSIAGLFPQANVLIGEHVERAAKLCIEKDETILLLQKSLAESQKLLLEVEFKLSLLKGATIALTGLRQLEHDGNTIEARHLATSWSDKIENAKQLVSELMTINDVKDSGDLSTAADDYASDSLVSENVNQKNIPQMKLYQLMQETVQVLPSLEARMRGTEAGCHDVIELHSDGVNLADNLLTKFEEARTTMEEADLMLNALLKASEKAEWLSGMWKQEGEKLMAEKAALVEEVEQLKSTLHIMDKENTEMQSQFHDIMEEMTKFMSFVKESFQQIGKDVEEWFRAVHSDSLSLKKDVLYGICNSRSSLEDICSNIMEKGFASFVLYQCHAAKLLSKSHSHLMASKLFAVQPQECHSINNLLGNLLCSGSSTSFNGVESIRELDLGATVTKKDKEEDILMYENQYLKKELERKDVLLKGVLFDFSLLQESASNTKDIKNESEKLMKALSQAHQELEGKTSQLHEVLLQCGKLEAHVTDTEASLSKSILDLQQAEETIDSLLNQNAELRMLLKDMFHTKLKAEEQLDEHKEIVKELEKEILSLNSSVEKSLLSTFENTKEDLIRVTSEKNRLLEEVGTLNDKLEMARAIADENEAIAVEARQESEACKLYAEQKEDEVKILEHSVEELEFTINVLEKKVSEMSKEVKKHQVDRDLIELDAEALRQRLVSVENFTDDTVSGNSSEHHQLFRKLHSKGLELDEAHNRIMILEDEREKHAKEMKECKDYISELVLHAEAQASQYQRKYKTLEAMFREVKADLSTTYTAPSSSDKIEKSSSRTRGSSSPFRCITSMVQQMNLEKDHELSMARLRVEELESIVASRQKEVCMLNTRLAAAESMTHDVIRDLLGIKSDVTNYANLIGELEIQKVLEAAQFQTKESLKKEQEIHNLMSQIKDLIEEKKSCFVESSKRDACALAAQLKLQQLEERNQLLTAQNELLKKEKTNLLAKVAELDDMMKKIFEMEKTQQRIESSARIEKFWNVEDANLTKRLANSEKLLFHVNDELPRYISSGILHEKLERQVSDIKRGNGKP